MYLLLLFNLKCFMSELQPSIGFIAKADVNPKLLLSLILIQTLVKIIILPPKDRLLFAIPLSKACS